MEGPPPELVHSSRSESGFKGVHRVTGREASSSGLWQCQLSYRGRAYHVGYFRDPEDGALAYALTARGLQEEEARGRLRAPHAQQRPAPAMAKAIRSGSLSPLTAATLCVTQEVVHPANATHDDSSAAESPCVYVHPLTSAWCVAAWCVPRRPRALDAIDLTRHLLSAPLTSS